MLLLCAGFAVHADHSARSAEAGAPDTSAVTGVLTLSRAVGLALARHPELAAREWTARADAHRALDATRASNPALELTDENLGGSIGSGRDERTLRLAQPFRWGGVGAARRRVANAVMRGGVADIAVARRELALRTASAFVEVWWLEQRARELERSEAISEAAQAQARERTRIGAAPAVEGLRARATGAALEVERQRTSAELESARIGLVALWGASRATFDSLALPPPPLEADDALAVLAPVADQLPEVSAASALTTLAAARGAGERAERSPELTPAFGLRHLSETNETGFVLGLSFELPLRNRGADRVAAADAEARAARAHEQAVRGEAVSRRAAAYRRMLGARAAYATGVSVARPAAREALSQLGAGYKAGRFSYLEYADGQRAAVEIELALLDAEKDYWIAWFDAGLGDTLIEGAGARP